MGEDIIAAFLRRLLEEQPGTTPEVTLRIEQRLRQEWGGERVYVGKATAEGKARRLGEALAAGVSLGEAMREAGCSRSGGYRLLSRRWRVR